jgi:hypothetical protein
MPNRLVVAMMYNVGDLAPRISVLSMKRDWRR